MIPIRVVCNSIGSCNDLCLGCGASTPHIHLACEPCPVNKEAKCVPVDKLIEIEIKFPQIYLESKIVYVSEDKNLDNVSDFIWENLSDEEKNHTCGSKWMDDIIDVNDTFGIKYKKNGK